MSSYDLTIEAQQDLIDIYLYTVKNFGAHRAEKYHDGFSEQFDTLAQNPLHGHAFDMVGEGRRRWLYQSHAIYYRPSSSGILVLRVLHQGQDPGRHIQAE